MLRAPSRLFLLAALLIAPCAPLRAADEPAKPAPPPAAGRTANEEKPKAVATPLRVLMVGDELSEKGHIGQLVARMAQAAKEPRRFYCEDIGSASSSLEKHFKGSAYWETVAGQRWDFVVLQEDARVILRYRDASVRYARELDRSIRKRRAQTVLFCTWAPQDQQDGNKSMIKAYDEIAAAIRANVLPVAHAWQEAATSAKDIPLYQADKRYASPQGEYLTACVFYSFFYGKSPAGIPANIHKGVKDEEAKALQAIAWKVVQDAKNAKPPPEEKSKTPVKPAPEKPASK